MRKYASVLVGTIAVLIAGLGSANADSGRRGTVQPETRESTWATLDYSTNLPRRPDMQTREGSTNWCDDSGGGLVCGETICDEFDWAGEEGGESLCFTVTRDQTMP